MEKWIIPALFLALPFALISPGLIWKSQLLFFIFCPIFIIALNIKNSWVKAFLLYASVWQIFIFLMGFSKGISPGPALSIILSIMAGAVIFKFISENKLPDSKWLAIMRIATLAQIFIAIPQHWKWNPFMKFVSMFTTVMEKLPGHLVGTLGNRNYLAAFIAISIPAFIGWKVFKIRNVTINPWLIGIFIFLFFCFSPGTLAAVLGLVFYYSFGKSKRDRILCMSLATMVCVAYTAFYVLSTGSHLNEFTELPKQLDGLLTNGKINLDPFQGDIGRFAMWMQVITLIIQHPLFIIFGYGPAAFWGREYPIHGMYFSVWFQYGSIGLVLFLGFIIQYFRFLSMKKEIILLTSFLIICLDMIGNFTAEIATTAFSILIICGLIERRRLNG